MASVAKRKWTHKGVTKETWIVRFLDNGGKHCQRSFRTKKEADTYRAKVETETGRGILAPDGDKITVGKAAEEFSRYMADRQRDGRIGETHRFRIDVFLRVHILPHLSNVRLAAVNLPMLTAWHRDIQAARPISPTTARHAVQALKMVFDFAMKREWVSRNPAMLLLPELRGTRREKIRTFTVEELRAVLLAAGAPMYKGRTPDANLRLQCAVHLAAFCGLRQGEIFGLRVENVDFGASVIRVRTSYSKRDGLKGPKSHAGIRDVAMPAHVAVLLRAWIERYQLPNADGLMFCYRNGKPMNGDGFRHGSWGPLLVRAGLSDNYLKPTFHFHALRHFAASWMIDGGWSVPETAKALGHAQIDMTLNVYAHALQQRGADVEQMQTLANRLLGAPAQQLRIVA